MVSQESANIGTPIFLTEMAFRRDSTARYIRSLGIKSSLLVRLLLHPLPGSESLIWVLTQMSDNTKETTSEFPCSATYPNDTNELILCSYTISSSYAAFNAAEPGYPVCI